MTTKRIDLGEYLITIYYNNTNSDLIIKVYDELGGLIESINVKDDDDIEDKKVPDINFN